MIYFVKVATEDIHLTTTVRPVEQVHALAAGPRKLVDMQLVIALVGFTRVPKVAGNY